MSTEKFLLIRPSIITHDGLLHAARQRRIQRSKLIEQLLQIIVRDNLIDAVLDDRDDDKESIAQLSN